MKRTVFSGLSGLLRSRWLKFGACAAAVSLPALGCTHDMAVSSRYPLPLAAASVAAATPAAGPGVIQAAARERPNVLPPAQVDGPATRPTQPGAEDQMEHLPINLDTVLRLADQQNTQIALARERVNEALAEQCLAAHAWLPRIYVGPTYYRHEGGIQLQEGPLIRSSTGAFFAGLGLQGQLDLREATFQRITAQRKMWQQKGELSRITNENLLDACNTYIDLLTTMTGEAVVRELEKPLQDLLKKATALLKTEGGAQVQYESVQAQLKGLRHVSVRLRNRRSAASAKLAYLLGLGPNVELIPVDGRLAPFNLVDATPPTSELVARALTSGPGIREMEALLAVVHDGIEKSKGPARLLPELGFQVYEGAFGAGRNDNMDWDNRLDVILQARWNLTAMITARERKRVAESKLQQAQLTYQDLRSKLTLGVQEAREAVLSGKEQIGILQEQLQHSREAHRLSHQRLVEKIEGHSTAEVLQSLRGLELSHIDYVSTLNAYDKAQLRLMLLLGAVDDCQPQVPQQ